MLALLRKMTEQVRHVTADGAYVGALQFQPGEVPKFVKPNRAINRKLVFVDLAELLFLGVEFVLNVARHIRPPRWQGARASSERG